MLDLKEEEQVQIDLGFLRAAATGSGNYRV